jgi:N utilization substance protein B
MSRKIAREEFFKLLFEAELNDIDSTEILDDFLSREDVKLSKLGRDFVEKYSKGLLENKSEVQNTIEENMTGWTLDRIGNVERTLLKFATYELLKEDVGHEIVINEIVELAKKYGEEKSHEFINGVLAKIVNK